ncbi:MAG: hypothetical protein ACFFD2_25775, partial [Promethearchaeota archaeon]
VDDEMKNSKDEDIPQDNTVLVQKEKPDAFTEFFQEIKDDIQGFSERSGEFFLEVKKDVETDWQKFKDSWKNMIKKIKNLNPKYRRLTKLYNKLKDLDSTVLKIREDTKEIKLEISEVAVMIEQLMEGYEDIESYMKENLGSDWKILKNSWQKCKEGEISKWEFAKLGLSKIGKRFAGIFIKV